MENLNKKTKMKWILVVVVRCRHRENGPVGTLRSDDGDGNENVILAIGLIRKITTLHVHHHFLNTSLTILHDYDLKMPNVMFNRGRKQAKTKFSFFLNLDKALRNSAPGEFAYIRQRKRDGVIAMKIEKPRIHFLRNVLPAVLVLLGAGPYLNRDGIASSLKCFRTFSPISCARKSISKQLGKKCSLQT